MKMDPLALKVLLNDRVRHLERVRTGQSHTRYRQARAVKDRFGKHAADKWNRMGPMKLYMCDSVREQIQKAIQSDCDRELREHGNQN